MAAAGLALAARGAGILAAIAACRCAAAWPAASPRGAGGDLLALRAYLGGLEPGRREHMAALLGAAAAAGAAGFPLLAPGGAGAVAGEDGGRAEAGDAQPDVRAYGGPPGSTTSTSRSTGRSRP